MLIENHSHSSSTLSSKNNRTYSKNKQKNTCVCIHEIIRFIIMKMRIKMKNRSHRYDIKRLSSRHGHKYSRYKNSLTMMMLISGVDSEILKRRGALCQLPWLTNEKTFRFQMVLKGQNNVRN